MPATLKSLTTTDPAVEPARMDELVDATGTVRRRRLPSNRPPTSPGEMLLEEFLKPLGLSQTTLAQRMGVSFPRLNEVVRGRRSVTANTALRLERVLGMPASFWLGLQQDWDLWQEAHGPHAEEIERLVPLSTVAGEPGR